MNPVFWILVWLVTFIIWLLCRGLFEKFGEWIDNQHTKTLKSLNMEEIPQEEKENEV